MGTVLTVEIFVSYLYLQMPLSDLRILWIARKNAISVFAWKTRIYNPWLRFTPINLPSFLLSFCHQENETIIYRHAWYWQLFQIYNVKKPNTVVLVEKCPEAVFNLVEINSSILEYLDKCHIYIIFDLWISI